MEFWLQTTAEGAVRFDSYGVIDVLCVVDVIPQQIRADENLREPLDIDSFDFLNVLIGLHERLGVEIPEADYGQLTTLSAPVQYLSRKLACTPEKIS